MRSFWDHTAGSGPGRRVYALTEAGEEQLACWRLQLAHEIDAIHVFLAEYEASTPPGR